MVHPIIDEYYSYNPYHRRSSKFAQDKGLVTNEKGVTSPSGTPGLAIPARKPLASSPGNVARASIHDSIASTLVPSTNGVISPAPTPVNEAAPAVENQYPHPPSDIRQLTALQSLRIQNRSARPQELGNTKKKRVVLEGEEVEAAAPEPATPPRTAYGDPLKIAQYFPELR